jgi:hypothetical protein
MQAAHLRVEDRVRIAQEPAVGVTVFVGPDGLPIDLDFEGAILQANGATDAASRQEVESRDSAIERILKIAGGEKRSRLEPTLSAADPFS